MKALGRQLDPNDLRAQIIGGDACVTTPFGRRRLLYADYTASGRALTLVEDRMRSLLPIYANTHTEDDATGRTMTRLLHDAEARIKSCVNAGEGGCVIGVASGATGAIQKMQQIIGVALAPATRQRMEAMLGRPIGGFQTTAESSELDDAFKAQRPVVFVGPYEHHSNEVTWRESLATVVEARMDDEGGIDLDHLESLLTCETYRHRPRIGSFSAASNVTGIRTPVRQIAALLHRHGALAFFDYAASAPYVNIDMNQASDVDGEDVSFDAIFISPHKFLGGPGASGILIFNERCYARQLPPTVAGGGTVDFVGPDSHHFLNDIEAREKAGTPGILQIIRAALVFEIKDRVGDEVIESREAEYVERAFATLADHPNIEILGNQDPSRRIGIVSFNIRDGEERYLHPRFVTTLLDDLFGIQSRAGCSCAGPYGHRLLGISDAKAERFRHWIVKGLEGIKPGWCRVGFHYVFDDAEVDHLISCIKFVAEHGRRFLPLYRFDADTGAWMHRDLTGQTEFDWQAFLDGKSPTIETPFDGGQPVVDLAERAADYVRDLTEARQWLTRLPENSKDYRFSGEAGDLQFFSLIDENMMKQTHHDDDVLKQDFTHHQTHQMANQATQP
ncbi:MAG: aminotransferase [marine bacterium B5-7]|nr:MAG: aminotransferase [marine bacterium B5-7]